VHVAVSGNDQRDGGHGRRVLACGQDEP
jgi:hypothetical protein